MDKLYPKISIITVCFNSMKTIEQTIKSVINQTYNNIEYIIIDGASTDGTVEIIRKYEDKIAYWISEPDQGIYEAMNKGVLRSTGDIIGIINSDDWYELTACENIVAAFNNNCQLELVSGIQRSILEVNSQVITFCQKSIICLDHFNKNVSICHPTIFVRKIFYEKYGLFNTFFSVVADSDLIMRALQSGVIFRTINKVVANYRIGGASGLINYKIVKERNLLRIKYGLNSKYNRYFIKELLSFILKKIISEVILNKVRKLRWGKLYNGSV